MTAAKALKHPWLTREACTKPLCTKRDMAKPTRASSSARRKLRKVALNVLAHHLTEKEASELSLVWKDLAKTKKALAFDDMKRTLRTHHGGTELELDELVRSLDVNGDHLIDRYQEFGAAMLARNRTIADHRLVEVFRRWTATARAT